MPGTRGRGGPVDVLQRIMSVDISTGMDSTLSEEGGEDCRA